MKKGLALLSKKTAVLVLLLIIALLIINLISDWYINITDRTSRQPCSNSVVARSVVMLKALETEPDLQCPIINHEIKGRNEIYIQKEIAERLADTWGTFGEGKLDVFKESDKTSCVIMYHITFMKKEYKLEMKKFMEYLRQNAYDKKQNYLSYLAGYDTADIKIPLYNKFPDNEIDTSKNYGIVITHSDKKYEILFYPYDQIENIGCDVFPATQGIR